MSRKYLLVPGSVVSRTDGDHHFVTSLELAALYGVKTIDCLVFRDNNSLGYKTPEELAKAHKLIVLRPRYDGNYRKPLTEQEIEMEVARLWISDTLDAEGDLVVSVTCGVCSETIETWFDAEDRAALIEFLQRFPLPPTGQETEND